MKKTLTNSAKIAFFDIETAPFLGWVWEKYDTNVIEFERDSYMLSFSIKWLGNAKVETYALPDFSLYQKDTHNDKELVMKLWELMGEADIIVAHNGDAFDIRKSNQRMIVHGLTPPEPYKTIDTLKLARKHFKFASNKLDDLGKDLHIGRKLHHTGFHLWKGCMDGNKASWILMRKYNAQDVLLLEQVYLKFRPWAGNHPNVTLYSGKPGCPKCGSQRVNKRGKDYTKTLIYQVYNCLDCRGYFRGEVL